MKVQLSIIIPVFNEEKSLPHLNKALLEYLKFTPLESQILLVDDGSTDNSLVLIKQMCAEDSRHRFGYVSLGTNQGLSAALQAGIQRVNTPYVGYMDADLQTNPKDFMRFFNFLDDHDMVIGNRAHRNDGFVKKLSSRIANGFRRLVIGDGIKDTCCPLKIIKLEYARDLPWFRGMHRFIPALVMMRGGKVKQIEIPHYPRIAGSPKYHLTNRLIGPFLDTLAVRWMQGKWFFNDLPAECSLFDEQMAEVTHRQ